MADELMRGGRHAPSKDDEKHEYVLMGPSGKVGCVKWMHPSTARLKNQSLARIAKRNPGAHIPVWRPRDSIRV